MKKLLLFIMVLFIPLIGFGQNKYFKNITVTDSIFQTNLATPDVKVLSPTSTGGTTVRETADGSEITYDTLITNFIDVTNDLDIGDTIEFDNGLQIYNTHADTAYIKEDVVKVEGDLCVTGFISNSHAGGLTYISTGGTQTIGTGGTFEKLYEGTMAYTSGHLHSFTESNGRLTYTGTPTIHVTITCNISIQSGETEQLTQFRIAKNGTTIEATNMARKFTNQNKDSCVGLNWMLEMDTNDYIEIYGTSDTTSDTFDINHMTLTIVKH